MTARHLKKARRQLFYAWSYLWALPFHSGWVGPKTAGAVGLYRQSSRGLNHPTSTTPRPPRSTLHVKEAERNVHYADPADEAWAVVDVEYRDTFIATTLVDFIATTLVPSEGPVTNPFHADFEDDGDRQKKARR